MAQRYLHIPDLMSSWPWPRRLHPLYEEVSAESNAWFKNFVPFTATSQYAFEQCDFGRLAALMYPDASREDLRIGMDLMSLFFVIDEYTDMVDTVADAIHNPHKPRPTGETILSEIVRQYAHAFLYSYGPKALVHFLQGFVDFLRSIVSQAEDRSSGAIRSTRDYIEIRRNNSGALPTFLPCELRLRLPDEVFYHPHIVDLRTCIVDLVTTVNDMLSYNREQATENDQFNLLTVVMHELETDLEGAVAWVVNFHDATANWYIEGLAHLPSFGPTLDAQLREYLRAIADVPRGVDSWSFESKRYFGEHGMEYQRTREVPLLARRPPDLLHRRGEVRVHLIEQLAEPVAVTERVTA
ncbi:terpenoid synthase [Trametes elegans]|nr:terpenoid synthase [Trametes elegans]